MINDSDKYDQPFGGDLGAEFQRVWDAIKANQVIPADGMKVSKTTGGTILHTAAAGGDGAIGAVKAVAVEGSLNQSRIDSDGWVVTPWVEVSGGNLLFAPLTVDQLNAAQATWGSSFLQTYVHVDHHLDYKTTGENWGGLVVPVETYISAVTSGKWASPMRLYENVAPYNSFQPHQLLMAFELAETLPAVTFTDGYSNNIVLPEINYIEALPYGGWVAVP